MHAAVLASRRHADGSSASQLEDAEGSVADDELRAMDVGCLQDDGVLLLWVTGRAMELGHELLEQWGYKVRPVVRRGRDGVRERVDGG
jgi:N6-adenosine-specific RNA methylase IME4